MKQELRRYPRVGATHLAAIKHADAAWWQMGRTLDLSLTGIALEIEAELAAEAPVVVALSMHDNIVQLHGKVVRSRADHQGAELAVEWLESSRRYWKVLSLTFADHASGGRPDQEVRPEA
jgi:hypothetical protein